MNLLDFWVDAHRYHQDRWVTSSDPSHVIHRLGVDLDGVSSVLDVGPGGMLLANYLQDVLGKTVFVHDIVKLDDPRFVAELPLKKPVDAAIAHLVLQHVPPEDHHRLMRGVMDSLVPGGRFYFDAVTEDTRDNPGLAEEYKSGVSFPFTAWEFVTSKIEAGEIGRGYYFCVAQA